MMNSIFEYGLLLFSMIDGKISPVSTIEPDPAQDSKPKLMNRASMVRMMKTNRMDLYTYTIMTLSWTAGQLYPSSSMNKIFYLVVS